ncbi:unnamed protein product, partial [Ixodes hexagonus]
DSNWAIWSSTADDGRAARSALSCACTAEMVGKPASMIWSAIRASVAVESVVDVLSIMRTGCGSLWRKSSRRIVRTFVCSLFQMVKHFLPSMKERGEGHIVCIASAAGLMGSPFMTDYCASKFAALGFMYALEEELYHTGVENIKLTTVCPVFINTGLFSNVGVRFPVLTPIMDTKMVASVVVDAILREESLVVVPRIIEVMFKLLKPLPEDAQKGIQRFLACSIQQPKA